MSHRKLAEHKISPCPHCNGTGEIIGPKQVELTPEDLERWESLDQKIRHVARWNSNIAMIVTYCYIAGTAFAVIISFNFFTFFSRGIIKEGITLPLIFIAIGCLMFGRAIYLAFNFNKKFFRPLYDQKRALLLQYGVEDGESYEIVNLKEGSDGS